jgi:hypothetical protein
MISFNKLDDLNPTDPLYYAPRQSRSVKDMSSKPFVVPEDAWQERTPVKAMSHPLSPEIVPAPPENTLQRLAKQASWRVIGAIGAAVALSAVLAFVVVGAFSGPEPKQSRAPSSPPDVARPIAGTASSETAPRDAIDTSDRPAAQDQAAPAPNGSDALLKQFLQWDKGAGPRAP